MRYLALSFLLLSTAAHATDCPAGAPSCKVITLTPEEENVLTGQRGIFDTAAQGRALDLANLVAYFRNKIATAPAGDVPKPTDEKAKVGDAPKTEVPTSAPDPRK